MPTASGHDRNNYATTVNFTKRRNEANMNQEQKTLVIQRDPVRKHVNEVLMNQETVGIPMDPAYVYIPDHRLREIVQKLVNSEQDRIVNNVDPNLITQINHRGYSLFFSRTGANPFEVKSTETSAQNVPNTGEEQKPESEKNGSNEDPKTLESQTEGNNTARIIQQADQTILPAINQSPRIMPSYIQSRDPVNLIYPETVTTPNPIITDQIPPEVNRVIQEDLAKNPLRSGERTYQVVLNENNPRPGEQPKVVKVVVRSQNTQKLPQVKPKYVEYVVNKSNEPVVSLNRNNSRNNKSNNFINKIR